MSRENNEALPGSEGEHELQERLGSTERAIRFYENSMCETLNRQMKSFIKDRIMFFLSTADKNGETDCSPRVGPPGFVNILDDKHLCYPEYRGNGVNASLGNITENPFATLLFIDWWDTTVGLHVNGHAQLCENIPEADDPAETNKKKLWVKITVEEAYIHCSKHIPQLSIDEFDPPWGTDDPEEKKSGFFVADDER